MKQHAEYAAKVRRLVSRLKKEEAASEPAAIEDMMDLLLHCILSTRAAESRAHAAAQRLRSGTVDINDLRVSSATEIVELIGADYPMGRAAADEIMATLTSVFNRRHSLNLEFLEKGSRKSIEAFLNSLAGMGPHAKALFILRADKGKALPLDWNMHAYLQKSGIIPMEMDVEEAHKFMASHVKETEMVSFYLKLKKFAGAHAPKKWPEAKLPAPEPVSAPAAVAAPRAGGQAEHRKSVKEMAKDLARNRKSSDGKGDKSTAKAASRSRSKAASRRK